VLLELGGKSPHVVFADANMDKAVTALALGIFSGGGQSCIAGSRIFVEESAYAAVRERLTAIARSYRMGPPDQCSTEMGSLASTGQRDHVHPLRGHGTGRRRGRAGRRLRAVWCAAERRLLPGDAGRGPGK
jgi:acyl-CoA reductase-like NAD-dependent aldehyde dehydrogenase